VLELGERHRLPLTTLLSSFALDDDETRAAMMALHRQGYLSDPHSALAWAALDRSLEAGEEGAFLCTAHPAKFLEVIEETLGIEVPLPEELAAVRDKAVLSSTIEGTLPALKRELASLP
jgi:threonine synthase